MNLVKKISFLFFLTLFLSGSLKAAELIMVEQQGCYYCLEWKDQLGHIYPKTPEGKFAPLKTIDITEIDKIYECDTFLPEIPHYFNLNSIESDYENNTPLCFKIYTKKSTI